MELARQALTMVDSKAYPTEEKMQADCHQWHWNTYPNERRMLFHVQQSMFGNAYRGSINKAIGVVKGPSDLIWVLHQGVTVYIELKLPNGTQQPEQKDFEQKVTARGHIYVIIRSFTGFKHLIGGIYGSK